MGDSIDIPPFPRLTWNGYSWAGEIRLPSWAGFQTRRGPYASISDPGPSDGTVLLTANAEAQAPPTPEQIVAFRDLLDNEAAVAEAVGRGLLEYYRGVREAYLEESDEAPEVTEVAALRPLVGLSSVHVLSLARDEMACVGFEFGCVWDDEHGAGVMTHRGRVIAIGQADCSFVEWMAKRGLG